MRLPLIIIALTFLAAATWAQAPDGIEFTNLNDATAYGWDVTDHTTLSVTPEAKVGDYVLVHVGVAISVIDENEAAETFSYLRQMGELDGLELPEPGAP